MDNPQSTTKATINKLISFLLLRFARLGQRALFVL